MTDVYSQTNQSGPATSGANLGGGVGPMTFYNGGNPNVQAFINSPTLQYGLIAAAVAVVAFLLWHKHK